MEQYQQYWLPGFGLSRHVVLSQIHCFLGPSATVRPFTYQGREGYLISGSRLTKEQIQDLADMSKKYELEASTRMVQTIEPINNDSEEPSSSGESIHKLIPVNPRERVRGRERESRDRKGYPSDRPPRKHRSC